MTEEELVDERGVAVPPGDRAQFLRDRMAAGYPDSWIPAPGDSIVGVLVRTTVGHMRENGQTRIAVLAVEGKEVSVWLHREGLRAKLEESGAAIGETIAIRYLGPPEPGSHSKAHRYQLDVDRPAGTAVDWSKPAGARNEGGGGQPPPAAAAADVSAPPPVEPVQPVQPSLVDVPCERCLAVGGHQVGCPNDPAAARCSECGWTGGVHKPGCSGIPF